MPECVGLFADGLCETTQDAVRLLGVGGRATSIQGDEDPDL